MGVHVIEQHPRDAAGQVHEVLVVLQLVFEGRVRQGAALADVVTGQQLFDVVLQIGRFFGGRLHAAAAEHRGVEGGVQHMQDGLMNDDLHGDTSFQRMISGFCSSIPQPTPDCERKTRLSTEINFTKRAVSGIINKSHPPLRRWGSPMVHRES